MYQFTFKEVYNYYGSLTVKEENGKYFWGIEDWNGEYDCREIPESLYNEIKKHSLKEQ